MNRALTLITVIMLAGFGHTQAAQNQAGQGQPKDTNDKINYSLGINVGRDLSRKKIALNQEYFLLGIKDGQANKLSFMTDNEIRTTIENLQKEVAQRQKEEIKEKAAKNAVLADKFLDENKKKKGVVTLSSELQYRIINNGKGDSPKITDTVNIHYRGKIVDGTEFASTYLQNQPVSFRVNSVIPGWKEALQLMKPGAKWEIFVPSKLAYGEHEAGPIVGPKACLIYEIELLSIEKAPNQLAEHSKNKHQQ